MTPASAAVKRQPTDEAVSQFMELVARLIARAHLNATFSGTGSEIKRASAPAEKQD